MAVISQTIDNEDKSTSIITKIGVTYPCDAETDEGKSLIHNNIDKIVKVYGKRELSDTSKSLIDIHYNSKGISFRCDRKNKREFKRLRFTFLV